MCTLVILHRVIPDLPLVLAANRDEFYAREAVPAHHLGDGIWAGLDRQAGGTWMGATDAGFFAGLTNQRSGGPAEPAPRSRGEVVMNLLRAGAVEPAAALMETLAPSDYQGFNALFGDARTLRIAYGRPDAARIEVRDVEPGIHVLPSDILNSPGFPKVERARRAAEQLVADYVDWNTLARGLASLLADRTEPAAGDIPDPTASGRLDPAIVRKLHALCVQTPVYGTRSSSLIALRPGELAHYEFADGPPCEAPFASILERR